MASLARWVVVCEQYTTKPFASRDAAERNRAEVEKSGHCQEVHRVIEVAR